MKLIVKFSDTGTAECEGDTEQELVRQAAFWHSLPVLCPVDDTPVRFGYKLAQGIEFYCLYSTGTPVYEFGLGNGKGERGMMAGKVDQKDQQFHQRWVYYDHDKKKEVVVWEDGRLLIEKPSNAQPVKQAKPVVQASTVEHRNITDAAQLDAMLDETADEQLDFDTIPGAVSDAQKIEALGLALYGDAKEWGIQSATWVKKLTKNSKFALAKLTDEERTKLLGGMETTARAMYDKKAMALVEAQVMQPDVDPDNLNGLALASAYTKLCKIAEKVPA